MYLLGLGEEEEQDAGEVVGVGVWEAQLVGQGIEEEVAALSVQVACQALKDVHCRRVHHWLCALQRLSRLHSMHVSFLYL